MRNRQLQRHLSRSIAAAWPPSPRIAACPLHDSSGSSTRRGVHDYGKPPGHQQQQQQPAPHFGSSSYNWKPWSGPRPKKSLFEELFPEEAKQVRKSAGEPRGASSVADVERSSRWVSQLVSEYPEVRAGGAAMDNSSSSIGNKKAPNITALEEDNDADTWAVDDKEAHQEQILTEEQARVTLILSGASKHLQASDFYRVRTTTSQAHHVEGWVSGILKVTQARDPDTLDPLGHYWIVFESRAAALMYRKEVKRLWSIAKANTPGARRVENSHLQTPPPLGLARDDGGGDLRRMVDAFTLVAPSQRFDLEIGRFTRNDKFLKWSNRIVSTLKRKVNSIYLVLLILDGNKASVDTIRMAIREDGIERNLDWRVNELDGKGVLGFGKSSVKKREELGLKERLEEENEAVDNKEFKVILDEYRRYSRFIVSFLDEAEALRFVRNWHRRHLNVQMIGEEYNNKVEEWVDVFTINASYIW